MYPNVLEGSVGVLLRVVDKCVFMIVVVVFTVRIWEIVC